MVKRKGIVLMVVEKHPKSRKEGKMNNVGKKEIVKVNIE